MASRTQIIEQAARRYGIPPAILYGVWGAESGFGANKGPSSAGARGDFQFMPGTAASLGVRLGDFRSEAFGAAKYLSQYKDRGTAGMLAAYNAGPAGSPNNPQTRAYIPKVQQLAQGWKGGGAGAAVSAPSSGGAALMDASTAASAPQEVAQGSQGLLPLIAALTQARPQARASGGLPMPSFGAHPALPGGYQIPVTGGGPAPKQDLNPLLAAIQTMGGNVPQAATQSATQGGTPQGAADLSSVTSGKVTTRGFPTGRAGKLIGFPHQGTHTLGNWQSDNAVDISVPVGTPMVALDNGVVVKVRQHPQGAGRFAGDQVTIRGANGNSYFYAHGVAGVKAGQRVRAGQVIGTTGSANGVAHLHFGVERGDPRQIIGRRR